MKCVTGFICGLALAALPLSAQPATGNPLAFEVASIKPNKSDAPPSSNFPLNSGDFYTANGGLFSASNFPSHYLHLFRVQVAGQSGPVAGSAVAGLGHDGPFRYPSARE